MEPTTPQSPAPFATLPAPPPPLPLAHSSFMMRTPLRPVRAGQLANGWSRFLLVSWLFVIAAFIAIWVSSRNTGLSTWWLGPDTEPRFIVISLLPFVAPATMCLLCRMGLRGLPWFGILGALVTAAIAAGDMSRVPGYAAAEFTVAAGALLASVACFAGVMRDEPT